MDLSGWSGHEKGSIRVASKTISVFDFAIPLLESGCKPSHYHRVVSVLLFMMLMNLDPSDIKGPRTLADLYVLWSYNLRSIALLGMPFKDQSLSLLECRHQAWVVRNVFSSCLYSLLFTTTIVLYQLSFLFGLLVLHTGNSLMERGKHTYQLL